MPELLSYDRHLCGGTIISEQHIITAGHCIYGRNRSYSKVRVGNIWQNGCDSSSEHEVEKLTHYDNYKFSRLEFGFDIGMIKVINSSAK